MRMFKFFDIAANAQQVVDVVVSVEQTGFFIIVDVESFGCSRCGQANGLRGQVYLNNSGRIFLDGVKNLLKERLADGDRQQEIIQGIVLKDIGEEAADDDIEACIFDGPCGVFAAGTAAEVRAGHEDFALVDRVVEDEVFFRAAVTVVSPVAKEVLPESVAAGSFEEAGGDDLVRIDVLEVDRYGCGCYFVYCFGHCW